MATLSLHTEQALNVEVVIVGYGSAGAAAANLVACGVARRRRCLVFEEAPQSERQPYGPHASGSEPLDIAANLKRTQRCIQGDASDQGLHVQAQWGASDARLHGAQPLVYRHHRLIQLEWLPCSSQPRAGSVPDTHSASRDAHGGAWRAIFRDKLNGGTSAVTASCVVLAFGQDLAPPAGASLALRHQPGMQQRQVGPDDHGCRGFDAQQPQPSGQARMLPVGVADAAQVAAASSVRVVGAGLYAWDVAAAVALLRHGEDVVLQQPAGSVVYRDAHTEHGGAQLLSSARRRALAASLQPHYTAPQPGPLGKVLRAPAKRRFWALVKDKVTLGRGGGGSSSGSSNGGTGEHLMLWAPSLHDPRFMPFLSAPLRHALLGGSDGAEGAGDMVLYRGMVHPDVPGLAFMGLEAHAGSNLLLLELQAQWLAAHLAGRLALPPAVAMRADVAAQRAWRSGALAHPLMSVGGSLARRHEQCYLEQLRQDLRSASIATEPEAAVAIQQQDIGAAASPAFQPLPGPPPVVPINTDAGLRVSGGASDAGLRTPVGPLGLASLSLQLARHGGDCRLSASHRAEESSGVVLTGSQSQRASLSQLPANGSGDTDVDVAATAQGHATAEAPLTLAADRLQASGTSPAAQHFIIARYRTSSSHGLIAASAPTSPSRRDQAAGAAARRSASRPVSSRFRHHIDGAVSEAEEADKAAGCCAAEPPAQAATGSQSHSAVNAGWLVNAAMRHSQSGPLHGADQPGATGPSRRAPRRSITTGTIGHVLSRALAAAAAAAAAAAGAAGGWTAVSAATSPGHRAHAPTAVTAAAWRRERRSTTSVLDGDDQSHGAGAGSTRPPRRSAGLGPGISTFSNSTVRNARAASMSGLGRQAAAAADSAASAPGQPVAPGSPLAERFARMVAASGLPASVLVEIVKEQHPSRDRGTTSGSISVGASPAQLGPPQPQLVSRLQSSTLGCASASGRMETCIPLAGPRARGRMPPRRASSEVGPSPGASGAATSTAAADSAYRLVICTPLSDAESDADASVRGGVQRTRDGAKSSAASAVYNKIPAAMAAAPNWALYISSRAVPIAAALMGDVNSPPPMRMSLQGSDRLAAMDSAAFAVAQQPSPPPPRGSSQRFGMPAAHAPAGLLGLSFAALRPRSTASPPASTSRSRGGMASYLSPSGAGASVRGGAKEQQPTMEVPSMSLLSSQANGISNGGDAGGETSVTPRAGRFHLGSFSVGGGSHFNGSERISAGGGDVVQELEEQMRALRTHLQNPAAFPFPSIGLASTSAASRGSHTPRHLNSTAGGKSTGKSSFITAGAISPSKARRSAPKYRASEPNLALLENDGVVTPGRKTDVQSCIPEETESAAAGSFLVWRRSTRPRDSSSSQQLAADVTAAAAAGSEQRQSLTGSLERPARLSRNHLHGNQPPSLLERTRSGAVAAATALASASKRQLHRLASVGSGARPSVSEAPSVIPSQAQSPPPAPLPLPLQLRQPSHVLGTSPPRHRDPPSGAAISSHDVINHLPAPTAAHESGGGGSLPSRFSGAAAGNGAGDVMAFSSSQTAGRTSGHDSVLGSHAFPPKVAPLGSRPRAVRSTHPSDREGYSPATAPIGGGSLPSPVAGAIFAAAASPHGLTDPLAHLALPMTPLRHAHGLLPQPLSSAIASPLSYQQSPSGACPLAHLPLPTPALASPAHSVATAPTPFGRCSASDVMSPRGSSPDGAAWLPSRSMSEHPDDARTPGPKSRGGATGTSAISAIPEERRSGSRHKSLRRQISAALLVLHRAATGAVGSSAKGTPAGGKESGGGGLFALASEAALLPYSKRIPRSLSRGGANSSSMGELSNAIALGVADSIAASPRVAVADGGREAPVRSAPPALQWPEHMEPLDKRFAQDAVKAGAASSAVLPAVLSAARRSQDSALPTATAACLPSRSAASATAAMLMRTAPPRTPTVNDAGHTVLPSRLAVVSVAGLAARQRIRASAPPQFGYACGPEVDVESQATRLPCLPGDRTSAAAGSDAAAESADVAGLASGPFEASAAGLVATLAVLQEATVEEDVEDELPLRLVSNILPSAISEAEALDIALLGGCGQRVGGAGSSSGSSSSSVPCGTPAPSGATQLALLQSRLQQHDRTGNEGQDVDELDVTVGPVGATMFGVAMLGAAHSALAGSSSRPQLEFVLSPPSQQAELLRRPHAGSRGSSGSGSIVLQLPSVRGGVVADLMAAVNTTRRTPHGGSDSEVDDAEEYDIFGLSHLLPPSRRTSPAGRIAAELAGQDAISLPLLQRAPQVPGNSSRSQELNLVSGCAIPPATAQHQSRPFPMQLSPSDLPLQQPLSADKLTDDFELLDPDADTALEDRLSPVGICARFTPGASPFRPAYASSRRLSLAPRCPNTVVGLADSLISTADGHGTSTGPPSAGWSTAAPGRQSMNAAALLLSSVHSASFGHGGGSHGGTGAAAGGGSMASRMLGTLKKMSSLVRTPTATPQQTAAPPRRSATGLSNGRGSIGGVLPPAFSHLASLHALAPGSVRDAYGGQGRGRGGDGRDGAASNAFTLLSQTHSQRSSGGSGAGSGCGSGQPTASPGASAGSPAASVPASRRTLVGGTSMLRQNPAHSHLQQCLRSGPRMSSPNLQDMHDDLLEAARWSAAQRQERDMKRHVTQRAQVRDRLCMVGMAVADASAANSHAPQQQEQQQQHDKALAGAVSSSQRPQLSEPLPSPLPSPLASPRSSRAPSPLLQVRAQLHAAPTLPLNWFTRHSMKVKTPGDAQTPSAGGTPPAAGSSRAFRRSCTSPRSPLSPAGREHSRMRNIATAEGSGPSSPLRSGSAHVLTAHGGSSNALHVVASGEVSLGIARAVGRLARHSSASGPGGLDPRALAAVSGRAADVEAVCAGLEAEAGPTEDHSGQGQAWLDAAAAGISEAWEHAHSNHGSVSSCGTTGALLRADAADVFEDGVRRGGPAWEIIQASRARQDQMVNQVSAWLREALAKKAAAAQATVAAQAAQ